jgi:serine/threonine-protein kinase TTK/MPS1
MELGEGDLGKVLTSKLEHSPSTDSSTTQSLSTPKLDFAFIRYWWKEMLQCVAAVHEKDIVHSDLKPANFLVVHGGLKLIDFGISGAIDVENTVNVHRDNHVGTPNYMSPESLHDASMTSNPNPTGPVGVGKSMKLGKPSDVWSLGCILYQMVYGGPPFQRFSPPMSKVMAIINPNVLIEFPLLGIGETKVPAELRRAMKACLQRDPSKRPTVDEMLMDTNPWTHPETASDLRISQSLLDQMIRRVAERFKDRSRPPPTDDEIAQYAPSFYAKIRDYQDEP